MLNDPEQVPIKRFGTGSFSVLREVVFYLYSYASVLQDLFKIEFLAYLLQRDVCLSLLSSTGSNRL